MSKFNTGLSLIFAMSTVLFMFWASKCIESQVQINKLYSESIEAISKELKELKVIRAYQ